MELQMDYSASMFLDEEHERRADQHPGGVPRVHVDIVASVAGAPAAGGGQPPGGSAPRREECKGRSRRRKSLYAAAAALPP